MEKRAAWKTDENIANADVFFQHSRINSNNDYYV